MNHFSKLADKRIIILFLLYGFLPANGQTVSWLNQGGYNQNVGTASFVTFDYRHNVIAAFETSYYWPVFDTEAFHTLAHDNAVIVKYDSSGTFLWGRVIANHNPGNNINCVKTDPGGNVYVTGTFWTSPLYLSATDSLMASDSGENGYVVKYDSNGNVLWAKAYIASSVTAIEPRALAIDNDYNVIVGGDFYYGANIGDTILTGAQQNQMLVKYDRYGHYQWATVGVSTAYAWVGDISCDLANNIYFTGKVFAGISFGAFSSGVLPGWYADYLFLAKLDPSGNIQWFTRRQGNYHSGTVPTQNLNCGNSVGTDNNGNVYVGGTLQDSLPPGMGTQPTQEVYIGKFRANGTPVWEHSWGAGSDINTALLDNWTGGVNYLSVDACGAPYITGSYKDSIVLGSYTVPSVDTNNHSFIAKIDTGTGMPSWVMASTGSNVLGQGLAVDKLSGDIAATGSFTQNLKFGADSISFTPVVPLACRNFYILDIQNPISCSYPLSSPSNNTAVPVAGARVYPNPVSDQLFIDFSTPGSYTIRIYDIVGRPVSTCETTTQHFSVNVAGYIPGVYLMNILDQNNNVQVKKFIKY